MSNQLILCIGDTHFPWAHRQHLKAVHEVINILQPDVIIQMGDLYDMYSWSRFARSHNVMTPQEEIMQGRQMAEHMWAKIRKDCPHAECYQLKGNHDSRPLDRTLEKYPEIEALLDIQALWEFPGVTTQRSERDELIINDIVFMHGYRSKLGDHARHNQKNTVCGHSHRGGVWNGRLGDQVVWELNAGHISDPTSIPLSYSKQRKISNTVAGFGLIDRYGPRFVALEPQ